MIRTGIYVQSGKERIYLDNLTERQRYVRYMTLKQKEKFAKFYVRHILKRNYGSTECY